MLSVGLPCVHHTYPIVDTSIQFQKREIGLTCDAVHWPGWHCHVAVEMANAVDQ